ncbi:hypothetical protein [Paenarthrobacter ureafaciens]|uniref:hypothetical protein n=1 Tax=Paenarthrobacter ureafaciens TaxID=37931 RepID=UPI002DBCE6EE|nr:hypothetical protein [Paenarthrobacter ureafaciens]MEC3853076.1 hypothetical protein [Paenarthrobacter ureafaciens]
MSNDRPNLSEAFAPVSPRGAKLEGLLAPKRRRAENVEQVESETQGRPPMSVVRDPAEETTTSAVAPDETPIAVMDSTKRAKSPAEPRPIDAQQRQKQVKGPKAKASDSVPGALRNVGVYLAPDLLLTVKERIHVERTTYADLLLDAFDALPAETLAQEFVAESVPSASGMPRRTPRRRGEAGIQIQVRLDGHQVSWLDDKVIEFNAPSRSALVSAAYRLYLAE